MNRNKWIQNVDEEINFWSQWIETEGLTWSDDYKLRCDPSSQLSNQITKHLGAPGPLSVLDVGSGPMTCLGKRWNGSEIHITACDALADEYKKLKYPPGLPLVPVVQCDSECLSAVFAGKSFDVVHARNTLDHGYDPIRAVLEMAKVTKLGGLIVLDHHPCEASRADHHGLHQFDFLVENGQLIVRGPDRTSNIFEELRKIADFEVLEVLGDDRCFVVLRMIQLRVA